MGSFHCRFGLVNGLREIADRDKKAREEALQSARNKPAPPQQPAAGKPAAPSGTILSMQGLVCMHSVCQSCNNLSRTGLGIIEHITVLAAAFRMVSKALALHLIVCDVAVFFTLQVKHVDLFLIRTGLMRTGTMEVMIGAVGEAHLMTRCRWGILLVTVKMMKVSTASLEPLICYICHRKTGPTNA